MSIATAPSVRPPPANVIASLKPKRVIIHSNPLNTTLKDVPRHTLVQRANEALMKIDVKTDGKAVTIRGVSMLPSGNFSFYTENKAQQQWLVDQKHVWSKEVHVDLQASPSTFSVMIHGIPRSFNINKPANLERLTSENNSPSLGHGLHQVRPMGLLNK